MFLRKGARSLKTYYIYTKDNSIPFSFFFFFDRLLSQFKTIIFSGNLNV